MALVALAQVQHIKRESLTERDPNMKGVDPFCGITDSSTYPE